VEPERLSLNKWAKLFNEYLYVTDLERRKTELALKSALADVLAQAFPTAAP